MLFSNEIIRSGISCITHIFVFHDIIHLFYATVTRANDNNNIMENVVEIFVSGATLGGGGAGVERQ